VGPGWAAPGARGGGAAAAPPTPPHPPPPRRGAPAAAGVPAELRVCPGAPHGAVLTASPRDYRSWVLGFLERALGE
jgi:hypothetical protein